MSNDEEKLKELLNKFGDLINKKELLAMEKRSIRNQIVSPEVQAELDALDEEFAEKEKLVDKQQEEAKQELKLMAERIAIQMSLAGELPEDGLKLKTDFASISVKEGKVVYDSAELDNLIKNGETWLAKYRKQESPQLRVMKTKM